MTRGGVAVFMMGDRCRRSFDSEGISIGWRDAKKVWGLASQPVVSLFLALAGRGIPSQD